MPVGEMKTFEDLKCWQACRSLRVFVSKKVVPRLPPDERFLLRPQILDSSRSSTANIAEGHGRHYYMDNAKFCRNSRGSTFETLDHLITAHDAGYIDEAYLNTGRQLVCNAVQLTNGYIRYLRKQKDNPSVVCEDQEAYGHKADEEKIFDDSEEFPQDQAPSTEYRIPN